jgi:type IV pilus assembly protein PilX
MISFIGSRHSRMTRARSQRGVALVVALILLVVATLLGLAASRGTILQERMSANSYDRSLAFQRSEAALRAAEDAITADWRIINLGGTDCSPDVTTLCPIIPANTFTGTSTAWRNVPVTFDINNANTPGVPQYQVQFMGTGLAENNMGTSENANEANYGSGAPPDNVAYYRITARSSSPEASVLGERSIVVLQSTVKRPY